jgi:hypothetical protein
MLVPVLRLIVIAGMALAAAFQSDGALANDTKAVFAAGGLTFVATDELRMEEETLVISPGKVAVSYRFRNLTSRDVAMTVAFPMPDIDAAEMSETPHSFHNSANDGDIFNFRVFADGKPVATKFEARAYAQSGGGEVTDVLKKFGVPLVDKGEENRSEVWAAIEKLDPAAIAELEKAGALAPDELHHPTWIVKAAYRWEQTFPASAVTAVEHRYEPVLGGSEVAVEDFQRQSFTQPWCPDAALADGLKKLPRYEEGGTHVAASWLEYVLKTGANWAGPISRFRLEIEKGEADFVSICPIPGLSLRKEGRAFTAEARDFTPATDLKVLFISGNCQKRPCLAR